MNLEEWTYAVKFAGSKRSKYEIKRIIKEQCLFSEKKVYGAYQIDGKKVWEILILSDPNCKQIIREKRFNDHIDIEAKIEEIKYHSFWSDNRRAYSKKRR